MARAYRDGLRRFRAGGGDVATIRSVASFFVSRLDSETDRRLDELGAPQKLKGKLGIANARLAYERYRQLFSSADELWAELAAAGAHAQRCLWASTSTKNPAYRDVLYVEELIGPDTVNTMPEETLLAFQDHGRVAPTLERGVDEAHRLLERLAVGRRRLRRRRRDARGRGDREVLGLPGSRGRRARGATARARSIGWAAMRPRHCRPALDRRNFEGRA